MCQLPFLFTEVFQIGIDAANPDVDGLCFEIFNEIELVLLQFIERYTPIQLLELSNGIQVQTNGILRPFLKVQPAFECSLGHALYYKGTLADSNLMVLAILFCSSCGGRGNNTSFNVETANPGCAVAVAYRFKFKALKNRHSQSTLTQ